MKSTRRRSPFRIMAAALSVLVLLGCGWWFRGDISQIHNMPWMNTPHASSAGDTAASHSSALRVQTFPNVPFEQTVEAPYAAKHPTASIDIIRASVDEYKDPAAFIRWMEAQKPDVVQVPITIYADLVKQGKLKPLDSFIDSSHFDLGALHQPLVQLLRSAGNGELYGLASEFMSSGLYINEDLFRKYGVPLPKDGITMEEVLHTAAQFQGTGVYGLGSLSQDDPFRLVAFIGQSMGLSLLDREGDEETFHFNEWTDIWDQIAGGYRDGWIANERSAVKSNTNAADEELTNPNLFMHGKTAMELGTSVLFSNLLYEEGHSNLKLHWSTRSVTLAPSATNQVQFLNPGLVYAINTATDKPDAAWELIAFMAGKENNRNTQYNDFEDTYLGLSAREGNMKKWPASQWEAFYKTKVEPAKVLESLQGYDDPAYEASYQRLNELASKQLDAVTDGTITPDAALQQLQNQLDP